MMRVGSLKYLFESLYSARDECSQFFSSHLSLVAAINDPFELLGITKVNIWKWPCPMFLNHPCETSPPEKPMEIYDIEIPIKVSRSIL